MTTETIKGLMVEVFSTPKYGKKLPYDDLILIGSEWPKLVPVEENRPGFFVDQMNLVGGDSFFYLRLPGKLHNVHTGCFAWTNDTRFRERFMLPLPIYLPPNYLYTFVS